MATLFTVKGPFDVPTYRANAARTITTENSREFVDSYPEVCAERGCYVFGIRAGRGFTPGYVGRATRSFKQEIFQPHKVAKYQQFLAEYRRGTPVLFFIILPKRRGVPNNTHIAELEDFLIQFGLMANPHLLNIKGTKQEEWGIAGVFRGGKGQPSRAAREFMAMMKIF